jgi:hypothetical protein
MKCSLIIAPILIYCLSPIALCKTSILYGTVRYAEDTTRRMWKLLPHLKQQPKAIQTQHSSMSNKNWDQL